MNDTVSSLSSPSSTAISFNSSPASVTTATTYNTASTTTAIWPSTASLSALTSSVVDEDDLTLTSETHLSLDDLNEINQSAEMQCLLQEHFDTTTFGNNSAYCLTQFDSILCWPRTPRATLAELPCLDEFQGIQYDSSSK